MTTNTTAGIDLDLDHLEALVRAATPGPWHWHECMDGNKMAELRSRSNALICDFGCDGKVAVEGTEPDVADMQFMAELNPATVLQLIQLARRPASGSDRTAAASAGVLPIDVEFKRLADTILQATTNGTRLEALRGMAELFDGVAATSGSDRTAAAGAAALLVPLRLAKDALLNSAPHVKHFAQQNRHAEALEAVRIALNGHAAPRLWTVSHDGKSVSAETFTECFAAARKLRTPEEQAIAAENLAAGIATMRAEEESERTELYQAARAFYNATIGDKAIRITSESEAKRDIATASSERLRAALLIAQQAATCQPLADCLNALRTAWHISGVVQGRKDIAQAIERASAALAHQSPSIDQQGGAAADGSIRSRSDEAGQALAWRFRRKGDRFWQTTGDPEVAASIGGASVEMVPLFAAPAPAAQADQDAMDAARWSKEPPTEQGEYWNWDGDEDHAPMIYHVLWSGTAKKCFVSMGQYGIDEAIWCDSFGGWWLPIEQPSVRAAMSQAKGAGKEGAA